MNVRTLSNTKVYDWYFKNNNITKYNVKRTWYNQEFVHQTLF